MGWIVTVVLLTAGGIAIEAQFVNGLVEGPRQGSSGVPHRSLEQTHIRSRHTLVVGIFVQVLGDRTVDPHNLAQGPCSRSTVECQLRPSTAKETGGAE